MPSLFNRQLRALIWKNWIVLSKHPWLTLLRCFVLPIAYGAFLATAQIFLNKPNNYGIGDPIPIYDLHTQFVTATTLVWTDATDGTSNPSPSTIMNRITSSFSAKQLSFVKQVATPDQIPIECPQNFNLFSQCFAAIVFNDIPGNGSTSKTVDYVIRADAGLSFIDVIKHTSDFEKRILPLQWAIDSAIIELQTGVKVPTPLEWPYTIETNKEQSTRIRLSYIRGLRSLLVLALFICFVGIAYQLPGAVAGERANMLTAHMKAMGLLDSARILSWHISLSLTYLPAWLIVALTWRFRIFTETSVLLILAVHLLLGLVLGSWGFFVAAPFGKSPQLAAVVTTFLAILFAIFALVMSHAGTGTSFIFSIIFPPSFYIFAIRAICGYENHLMPTNALKGDPDNNVMLLPLLIAALIDVFLWPYIGVLIERRLYEVSEPSTKSRSWRLWKKNSAVDPIHDHSIPENTAISIRNLTKVFKPAFLSSKDPVTAVSDLSLDIPKNGIFVLLGSNGAGKSTALSIIGGLTSRTSGIIKFEGNVSRPPRGKIGIVPQKNVLFPELNCLQTLRVWRAVKWSPNSEKDEDLEQLLKDCDLEKKINSNAAVLSGGQKRKLQLAIGLVGGSQIVLVDECTSGVDPLSRRALWRALTSVRDNRTVVFTTHFLDEADLLADDIAMLAAPGKLVASGSPVALKRDLGEGYSVQVSFNSTEDEDPEKPRIAPRNDLLDAIRTLAPQTYTSFPAPHQVCYHLKLKDTARVQQVLQLLEEQMTSHNIVSYDVLGTSVEDIFLDLMGRSEVVPITSESEKISRDTVGSDSEPAVMHLTNGRPVRPLQQAFTILHKRLLIARRSWLTPLLAILIAIAGAAIPLVFLRGRQQSCIKRFANSTEISLFLPDSPIALFSTGDSARVLTTPPGIASTLGNSAASLRVNNIADNATFVNTIKQNYLNLLLGGVSLDLDTGASLVAWEASPPGYTGPSMLNLASNILYNHALNTSGFSARTPAIINATYDEFPPVAAGTLFSLKWLGFFGLVMSVYPAFFALYVTKERRSSVQAMQLSNGLTNPIGMWLGHLMFDTISVVILSTIIVIVFAAASNQFHGLGFFWFIMVQYGIAGALFAYCVSLAVSSPLAAFAAVAGYQVVVFILYLSGYLLVLTYGNTNTATKTITIIHYTTSLAAPVASVSRAALVSVNLFSLLCNGNDPVDSSTFGTIGKYGGPILYLFIYSFVLLAILVWADSGSILPQFLRKRKARAVEDQNHTGDGMAKVEMAIDSNDILQVLNVSKSYDGNKVVDDVSLGLPRDTVFALLGPNGAGKTTTFNMIRGDVVPDSGDILINSTSVIRNPRTARLALGVCPQFTAIDSQMTVKEHLDVYGRLKGLKKGLELEENVDAVLKGTSLYMYADRLASKLSGGNQRKLSLAISLIGNPSVILIDEFSTGIDAKMKREMWQTLRNVSIGKAVIITTHSMEEASALANRVGIISKRLLAVGTTESLTSRYGNYEVHFTCRTREDAVKARAFMERIPGSKMADDVATRFEVPLDRSNGLSLADLFRMLSSHGEFTEYTVEKATLESIFLKVIRENDVLEQDDHREKKRSRWPWAR